MLLSRIVQIGRVGSLLRSSTARIANVPGFLDNHSFKSRQLFVTTGLQSPRPSIVDRPLTRGKKKKATTGQPPASSCTSTDVEKRFYREIVTDFSDFFGCGREDARKDLSDDATKILKADSDTFQEIILAKDLQGSVKLREEAMRVNYRFWTALHTVVGPDVTGGDVDVFVHELLMLVWTLSGVIRSKVKLPLKLEDPQEGVTVDPEEGVTEEKGQTATPDLTVFVQNKFVNLIVQVIESKKFAPNDPAFRSKVFEGSEPQAITETLAAHYWNLREVKRSKMYKNAKVPEQLGPDTVFTVLVNKTTFKFLKIEFPQNWIEGKSKDSSQRIAVQVFEPSWDAAHRMHVEEILLGMAAIKRCSPVLMRMKIGQTEAHIENK